MKRLGQSIAKGIRSIDLVDRVLITFMAVLLTSMAVHLFAGTETSEEVGSIDTIVRTSASAIFGYFISANFLKPDSSTQKNNKTEALTEDTSKTIMCCSRLQILIVSTIGLISLLLLLIARNNTAVSSELTATVSQFRDFVSASIGYLVSCGKKH